ncbi:MAG: sigma-70 family RNA polymerase sigma factor [Planctomycetota bacterium]|jgi:RNA polymerase sigma-70 factor (ECF subfamily)|nr:sigma-70 family RNA polymerase sigma factor [Planctomycetota bacterium]
MAASEGVEEVQGENELRIGHRSRRDGAAGAMLLTQIAKGDEEALKKFYDIYFEPLYRFVFYRVWRDHQHAEEVVQDTFMAVLENAGKYSQARGTIESWLVTLSRNFIRSNNTLMRRPREHESSWDAMEEDLENLFLDMRQGNIPDSQLESDHLRTLIGEVMATIPQECSTILEMKYKANLTIREIAKAIHKTEKAVESQLTRARSIFREAFKALSSAPAAELGF